MPASWMFQLISVSLIDSMNNIFFWHLFESGFNYFLISRNDVKSEQNIKKPMHSLLLTNSYPIYCLQTLEQCSVPALTYCVKSSFTYFYNMSIGAAWFLCFGIFWCNLVDNEGMLWLISVLKIQSHFQHNLVKEKSNQEKFE